MSWIGYLIDNMWQLWLIVALISILFEIFTSGFFIACFAVGALSALITSFFGGVYLQLTVYTVVSAISIFLVRPFAVRYLNTGSKWRPSNADALIGRTGLVVQTIESDGYGRIEIDGDNWKVESEDGTTISAGTKVMVTGRESIILKVKKICS